jgi:hypothetical protein
MKKEKYLTFSYGVKKPVQIQIRRIKKICENSELTGLLDFGPNDKQRRCSIFYLIKDKNVYKYVEENYPEILI